MFSGILSIICIFLALALSHVKQYDDSDTAGDPELFSIYIGNEHGIQGHHNSCYLDATVFGLFALSGSFDMMLLEEPQTDIGRKIKYILWKGIVNPLRRYLVINPGMGRAPVAVVYLYVCMFICTFFQM